jgi:hypothetical protein
MTPSDYRPPASARIDDLVEIQQTLAKYAVTITQGDIDGLISVFTPARAAPRTRWRGFPNW